jgi:hypothetical protein
MIGISRNKYLINIHVFMFDVIMVIGIGSSSCSAVSPLNIVKNTVIKKRHDGNGSCVEFLGLNLHSKGIVVLGLHYFS